MAAIPEEITRPLSIVDALFAQHISAGNGPEPEFGEREHFHKAIGLDNEEGLARIPCLNDVELAESIPPFTLVRYRALVQDVFEPELFASVFEEVAESGTGASETPRLVTTKYRDCVEPSPGCLLKDIGDSCALGQRGACYCVPLPGETPWARAAAVEWTRLGGGAAAAPATGRSSNEMQSTMPNGGNKRGRSDEDVEMAPEEPRKPRMAETVPARVDTKAALRAQSGMFCSPCTPCTTDSTLRTAEDFGLNFPIPSEEKRGHGSSTACIVKLYDADAESLKICQAVEIIGVLCINPQVVDFSTTLMEEAWRDARQPSTALVPRLHAVAVRHLPFHHPLLPYTCAWLSEARLASAYHSQLATPAVLATARDTALTLLASQLGGDLVVAEYVLMLLVSRSFGKHGDTSLGSWSLNIAGWPNGGDTRNFVQTVAELVPRAVRLEVTAGTLNTKPWRPKKDYVANRLVASQLQLAAGTLLVLDETGMTAGSLGVEGVKSLMAIQALVTENLLTCDFMSYDVKLPLEVSSICVSERKSIVKDVGVLLPLRPAASSSETTGPAPAVLKAARWLIALVTRIPRAVKISDQVAERFSEDFAAVRQELDVPAELGHTWMCLARARCLTLGEEELSMERWQAVFELERERLQRCKADGLLAQ